MSRMVQDIIYRPKQSALEDEEIGAILYYLYSYCITREEIVYIVFRLYMVDAPLFLNYFGGRQKPACPTYHFPPFILYLERNPELRHATHSSCMTQCARVQYARMQLGSNLINIVIDNTAVLWVSTKMYLEIHFRIRFPLVLYWCFRVVSWVIYTCCSIVMLAEEVTIGMLLRGSIYFTKALLWPVPVVQTSAS